MTDQATLRTWIAGLGLDVKTVSGSGGDELWVTPAHEVEPRLVLRPGGPGAWEIVHDRRVPASALSSDWRGPRDAESPTDVVGRVARQLACGFPLVDPSIHDTGGDVIVRLRAPVFDEGLTRQAFALTVSSVLKAAQRFDLGAMQRTDELAPSKEYEGTSEPRIKEQQALMDRMTPAAPSADATAPTSPAAAWAPTHELKRQTRAWAQPDGSGAVAATLQRRVPVQVVERQGDWARVLCSNGWSGWIDGRELKVR